MFMLSFTRTSCSLKKDISNNPEQTGMSKPINSKEQTDFSQFALFTTNYLLPLPVSPTKTINSWSALEQLV